MEYAVETLSLIVKPLNAPIYSDLATTVTINDMSGGPFISVSQDDQEVRFDPDEWPAVRSAIDGLMNRLQWHTKDEVEAPEQWLCSDYKHSGDPMPMYDATEPSPNF